MSATEKTVLGTSGWRTVTQGEVDAFAELTGDCQWIRTARWRRRSVAQSLMVT